MKPINIAQIGTGHDHASQILVCMKRLPHLFNIVGICEPNPRFASRLSSDSSYDGIPVYKSVEELFAIPELQAITVETEEQSCAKYAKMCIDNGFPIHVDKPGGYIEEEFLDYMYAAKQKNIPVHFGYMYRFNPLFRKALALKESGELGDIFSVEAQMSVHHVKEKREWLRQFQGGMTYFLGCHLIDLVMQLQGNPEEIIPFNCCTGAEQENSCEDFGFAVLKYPNGASFIKTCSAEINGFGRRQLVICGTKGTFEIKPLETKAPAIDPAIRYTQMFSTGQLTLYSEQINDWTDCSEHIESAPYGRFDDLMTEFARIVQGEIRNPYPHDYEIQLFKNILKACGR